MSVRLCGCSGCIFGNWLHPMVSKSLIISERRISFAFFLAYLVKSRIKIQPFQRKQKLVNLLSSTFGRKYDLNRPQNGENVNASLCAPCLKV